MQKPPTNQTFFKFVGTWRLVECVEMDAKGTISYPWGQDAIGYLIYTLEGIMAVQIMRKNRKLFRGKGTTQATSQERQSIVKDYNAYFGEFEVDEANKVVIHRLEGNVDPNQIGKKKTRMYSFYDNKLSLTTQGEIISRKITWQKVLA